MACLNAFNAWKKAGADGLDIDHPAVTKPLTACRTLSEWLGGLHAVPEALGYTSASELNDLAVKNDVQVVCIGGNENTPVCKDAGKRHLLNW